MKEFQELVDLMKILRGPNGCSWDKEQTIETTQTHILEEAYEVIEAVRSIAESGNYADLREELGDLISQAVFMALVAEELGQFTIRDSLNDIVTKLRNRHPHVFGDVKTNDTSVILKNWEKIKADEKKKTRNSVLDGITTTLPALAKAYKIQYKAARWGFQWKDYKGALKKVYEELEELTQNIEADSKTEDISEEIGDILFSIVNVARYFNIDPEIALESTVNKFFNRFKYIEQQLDKNGIKIHDATLEEMDAYWNEAKSKL